ncbi:phosphonate ABC transporter substrate-binding protein [Floricoccus penangensis]|uniref:Phosphonate ABC transporter substrate-binding protein n=1 Tax=Floricoccus penangensis TaxID=1859475 RepID=A0A9Q5JI48_9LACT|nr:PhnD/SsuA/transferrin family substrate-binding protein [Floricoccus penangensis]OFI47991.1 phosphonate ABC transporter substrate-binding protein [Floricoccus penangensis]
MKAKKLFATSMVAVATAALLVGCGSKESKTKESDSGSKALDELNVMFVPSKNPDDIKTATEPLSNLLKEELKKEGVEVKDVKISVGTDFQAVGEALSSGTADVGYGVPGGTYAVYKDETDVILTATRKALNKDSEKAKDWNDGKPTVATDEEAKSYRSLLIAGPSAKGQELAKKVNAGEELTWDDLNGANWGLASPTSSAGYIYPSLWLNDNVKHNITELKSTVQNDSYGSGFARLASGQIDVMPVYADARRDFEKAWSSEYGKKDIWTETNVIGVTVPIYNDAILVSKKSDKMDDKVKGALQNALINMAKTEEGKKVIAVYSHTGYVKATDSDYDTEVKAQELMKSQNKK